MEESDLKKKEENSVTATAPTSEEGDASFLVAEFASLTWTLFDASDSTR